MSLLVVIVFKGLMSLLVVIDKGLILSNII